MTRNIHQKHQTYRLGQLSPEPTVKRVPHSLLVVVAVFVVLVSFVLIAVLLWPDKEVDCGTDVNCFVEHALACKQATFRLNDAYGEAQVTSKGCTIEKTVTELNDAVPELTAYIVGHSMTCTHPQGVVPTEVLDSLSSGMQVCDGELKDRLLLLKAAS